ncbi:MAG: hypothetical protein RLZZ04_4776 [Cyanobacteriota bacterium]
MIRTAASLAKPPKIAIVGGGIAGLNAAYQLHKSGLQATVYEAKSQVGGRIRLGRLIFAGEHFSDEFYGYMNGGAQTGRLAALVIIENIGVAK